MKRVLVIEDNEQNMYLIQKILQKLGHQIIEARDGQKGLELALSEKPDLILMDIQLPIMDGYTTATEIRKTNKDIPIIAVTSFAMDGDKEKALNMGFTEYVEKPIDPQNFIKILKIYLD